MKVLEEGASAPCECGLSLGLDLPSTAGFHDVVLYTRSVPDCPLCREARDTIESVVGRVRQPVRITVRLLDGDARLTGLFGEHIPVVFVDGRFRFRGRVVAHVLKDLLRTRPGAGAE